jgi:hypothetical protein
MQGSFPLQGMSAGGNPALSYGNQMGGGFPPYNQGHQGFTQNPGPSKALPGNLVPVTTQVILFGGYSTRELQLN